MDEGDVVYTQYYSSVKKSSFLFVIKSKVEAGRFC